VALRADPSDLMRRPRLYLRTPRTAWNAQPKRVRTGPVLQCETSIGELPQLVSWPDDGGPYITLPQVYSHDPEYPASNRDGLMHSNLGMYRVQLAGGQYEPDREVGMHYQLHRGLGVHHAKALQRGERLRVNVFIGGPPAMSVAAVMPLPEGMTELTFAGMLGGRRVPMLCRPGDLPIAAEADFCITGWLDPDVRKPEGPFGDHLGYYSLAHEFPVLRVERVRHRRDAIWPFTVVGRPPQEDTVFGELIHELTGPIIPQAVPGVKAVHAVDAAGVHPLLLAVGSERYAPYDQPRQPRELLTEAHGLLGQGQLSLAKYLMIVAAEDDPSLDARHVAEFFRHLLERVDWRRDLHFHTRTTIDTLDYSGDGMHAGSKLVIAAAGPPRRNLPVGVDRALRLPKDLGFTDPRLVLPGILVVRGPAHSGNNRHANAGQDRPAGEDGAAEFCRRFRRDDPLSAYPLVVVVDDAAFAARSLENFLWVTFTRSNPAADVHGVEWFEHQKHFGCRGSLVIDARAKPHHAPPLVEDPAVTQRVNRLAGIGGPLHGLT
jgi:4-hydroxy-3-polyprenylbenzoate decarboxylase